MNSSAALTIVPDEIIPVDSKAQRRTAALSKVIGQINKLERIEHDVIALLPSLSDDEVMETRCTARLLYASAWKIEIACDAEIWERTEAAMRGRGNKDVDEKGLLAAVNKRADDLGCSARTVYENARIFRRFKEKLATTCNILDDKGFFQAALASNDPDTIIEEFAEEKTRNAHFKVADAWRRVKADSKPDDDAVDETIVLQTTEAQEWLQALYASVLPHTNSAPAPFLETMARSIAGVILKQSERTVEGDCRVIMEAIEENNGLSGDDLFDWHTQHFHFTSEEQLKERLALMIENKELVEDDAGPDGRQAKRRGALPKWYAPFYVKRKKQEGAMCGKCGEWHRNPEDCLED